MDQLLCGLSSMRRITNSMASVCRFVSARDPIWPLERELATHVTRAARKLYTKCQFSLTFHCWVLSRDCMPALWPWPLTFYLQII